METDSGLAKAQNKLAAFALEWQTLNLIAVDNVPGVAGRGHGWHELSQQLGTAGFDSAVILICMW